eukprot:TRINITY_DN980_c0_g2_i1.p1 TRINITY_DN980_c0_g2~~TRINITY_DN980_c0_g2_i1.p1  ORF type:complete len:387 (+),score=50.38 TRINITY_DN980_c0_g2_i1:740-1900(+)
MEARDYTKNTPLKLWTCKIRKTSKSVIHVVYDTPNIYATEAGNVHYIEQTGTVKWTTSISNNFKSMRNLYLEPFGDFLIVSGAGRIVCLLKTTGEIIWENNIQQNDYISSLLPGRPAQKKILLYSTISIIIQDFNIFFGLAGIVGCLDINDGTLIWCRKIFKGQTGMTLLSYLTNENIPLLISTCAGEIIAIRQDGNDFIGYPPLQISAKQSPMSILLHMGLLYVSQGKQLHCLDPYTMRSIWQVDLSMNIKKFPINNNFHAGLIIHPRTNHLYVGFRGYLVGIEPMSGTICWTVNLNFGLITSVCIYKHLLIVGTQGRFMGVKPENGEIDFNDGLPGLNYFNSTCASSEYYSHGHADPYLQCAEFLSFTIRNGVVVNNYRKSKVH